MKFFEDFLDWLYRYDPEITIIDVMNSFLAWVLGL